MQLDTIQPVTMFRATIFGRTKLCTEAQLIAIRDQIDGYIHTGEITLRRLILNAVAAHFNVHIKDIMGRRKPERISVPRQVSMTLFRDMAEDTWTDIGNQFNRDHTTAIHAWRSIHERAEVDAKLKRDLDEIKKAVHRMIEDLKKQKENTTK